MSSPSSISYVTAELKPPLSNNRRSLSPITVDRINRKTYPDVASPTPLAPNFHAWRINALTSTTLKQTDFLLRAQNELATADTSIVHAALKVLDDNHIGIPEQLFPEGSTELISPPNFLYIGLLHLLHVPVESFSDSEWISVCRDYLAEFPKLFEDLLGAFGIQEEQPKVENVASEPIISPDALFLAPSTSNEEVYPVASSIGSENSSGAGTESRRTRIVTFDDSSKEEVNEKLYSPPQTTSPAEKSQQVVFDGSGETLFQQESTELLLTGQRIVYDLHVAMMDRPGETRDLVKRHEEFFNRIRSCLLTSEKRDEFDRILFEPRDKLDDLAWIRAISSLIDSAPALLAHFKELVGYDHHDSEGVEFDYDEDEYYYEKEPEFEEFHTDEEDDIRNDVLKTLSAGRGSPPPTIDVAVNGEVLEDGESDLPREYFGVWNRIFMHLRDNPAIVKGLEKDYPQFFVNLRSSFTAHRSAISMWSSSAQISTNNLAPAPTGPIKLDSNPATPQSGLGIAATQQGPALGNINWESVEYQRFRNILLADRSTVTDEEWLEEVHAVLGAKRNLLDQFKEIVAYELEVDEDEINRYDQMNFSEEEEEPIQPSHARKTPSSYVRAAARSEFVGMSAAEIEKKYQQFFAQLHQHLRQHGHPPRAFSRFMRILRAPRDFIADDKWLCLLTHSFLGGSRKLRKAFRTLVQATVDRDGVPDDVDSDDEDWSGEYAVEFRKVTDISTMDEEDEDALEAERQAAQKRIDAVVEELVNNNKGLFDEIQRLLNPPEDPKASKRPATSIDPYTLLKDHLRVLRSQVHDTAFVVRIEEIMGMGKTEVYAPNGLYSRLADVLGIHQLSVHAEELDFDSTEIDVPIHPLKQNAPPQSIREQLPEVLPALEVYVLIRQALGDGKVFAKILHEFIDLRERERQTMNLQQTNAASSAESPYTNGAAPVTGSVEPNKPMRLSEVLKVLIKDVAGPESEAMKRFDALVTASYEKSRDVEAAPPVGFSVGVGLIHPVIDAALGLGAGQKMMATYVSMFGDNYHTGAQS